MTPPDLDRFARLDSLGLTVTGQQIFPDHAVLFCEVTVGDDRCAGCGGRARRHDTVVRRFTHLPLGHRPTWLQVATPRYECPRCDKGMAASAAVGGEGPVQVDSDGGDVGVGGRWCLVIYEEPAMSASATPFRSKIAFLAAVAARCSAAIWLVILRFASSGKGEVMSCDRRPASRCTTGICR